MNKLHKIFLGVFCCGVLLCGIGAGVAFVEFSQFTYGGVQTVGELDLKTADVDVEFEPEEEGKTSILNCGDLVDEIQMDRNVPEGTVRFSVTYNAARVEPEFYWEREDHTVVFYRIWRGGDDVAALMAAKDLVLTGLRERKIYSFETVDFQELRVKVNPANIDDVRLGF